MSIFMKVPGVEGGESSDARHADGWIDIVSLEWGTTRAITSATGTQGDRESANATITDLELTRYMDAASPRLFGEACCGRGREVTVELTKTGDGGGAETYMAYTLSNALFSAYDVEANAQDVSRPLERLVLSFVDVELRYTPYDEDGKALAPIAVRFDTATNQKR